MVELDGAGERVGVAGGHASQGVAGRRGGVDAGGARPDGGLGTEWGVDRAATRQGANEGGGKARRQVHVIQIINNNMAEVVVIE